MRLFDPFSSLSSTKIGIFIKKSMSTFTFDQKNRAQFLSRTISCVIFLSCTNREIVHEFFRDFEPCLRIPLIKVKIPIWTLGFLTEKYATLKSFQKRGKKLKYKCKIERLKYNPYIELIIKNNDQTETLMFIWNDENSKISNRASYESLLKENRIIGLRFGSFFLYSD